MRFSILSVQFLPRTQQNRRKVLCCSFTRSREQRCTRNCNSSIRHAKVSYLQSQCGVVYGQESQKIHYKVAGPEPLPCKLGPSKGGALVLFRASFSMDECVCGEMADEYYKMHPLGISHNDLVTEAARLLAKAEIPY